MGSKSAVKGCRNWYRRFRIVCFGHGLKGEQLGAYLRKNGIYKQEYDQWMDQIRCGMEQEARVGYTVRKDYRRQIEKLKKELAEAHAIIEAQKKIQVLLSEEAKKTVETQNHQSSK